MPLTGQAALRIDRTHRIWAFAFVLLSGAAVALHWWLGRETPGGLSGGTRVGLLFGIAGSLVMLFVGSLSLHRRLPVRRWLGRRQDWLRAHLWLGLLSVVLVLVHSNYRLGGPLTQALWAILAITTVSGIVGALMQHVIPRMISALPSEAPYEQIPQLCRRMREEADEAFAAIEGLSGITGETREKLRELHEDARSFLSTGAGSLADPIQAGARFDEVAQLVGLPPEGAVKHPLEQARATLRRAAVICEERRHLARQERLHRLLHLWLLVHVPITLALLVLGVAHACTVYW